MLIQEHIPPLGGCQPPPDAIHEATEELVAELLADKAAATAVVFAEKRRRDTRPSLTAAIGRKRREVDHAA